MSKVKRYWIIAFTLLTLSNGYICAQVVNTPFPEMATSTADGKEVALPVDTRGKYTLLGLAFSQKSESDLNTWMEPVYWKFIDKREGNVNKLFGSHTYDVNVYFVPMFTGIKTAATKTAKKQALKKMDPRLIPSILFYKGKLKPYKDALDFQQKDIPYFFVLDERGVIIYATSGRYTDAKMAIVEELLGQ